MRIQADRRRQIALAMPEGKQTRRDPRTAISRSVGPKHAGLQFWTQLTVELDSPPVWRCETWFAIEHGRHEVPLHSWSDTMVASSVDEAMSLIPHDTHRTLYKDVTPHSVIWRAKLDDRHIGQMIGAEVQE